MTKDEGGRVGAGFTAGEWARYSPDFGTDRHEKPILLEVEIICEVEGWYEVRFSDHSHAIVRPSHLAKATAESEARP